jgi:hypothetical protein
MANMMHDEGAKTAKDLNSTGYLCSTLHSSRLHRDLRRPFGRLLTDRFRLFSCPFPMPRLDETT